MANNLFYTCLVADMVGNIIGYGICKKEIKKIEDAKLGVYVYDEHLHNMEGYYVTMS